MRHLGPYLALLAIAAITGACSSPPGSGAGGGSSQESQPSQGSQPSQAAASSAGGGSGGANGSITYEITGEYEASGELPFLAGGVSLWVESAGGWVANFANQSGEGAVILLNTQAQSTGQIFTYGDGTSILAATSDPGSGFDCTFTLTKNDESGLKGDLDCSTALVIDNNSGAQKKVHVTAHWDAHP